MEFESEEEANMFLQNIDKKIARVCCPIFVKENKFDITHSEKTPNGTLTFIKYNNAIFECTCKHVIQHAITHGSKGKPGDLNIQSGRSLITQSSMLVDTETNDVVNYPTFLYPQDNLCITDIDLAIKPVPTEWFYNFLSTIKDVSFIDLDDYKKPDYSKIKMVHAFGWLNDHKNISGDKVATKLAHSVVELSTTGFNENCYKFQLRSELPKPHGLSFSGMSGGPVMFYDEDSKELFPLGIIYEGQPGSERPNEESFMNDDHLISYECYNLTPDIFGEFVKNAKYNWELDEKYKHYQRLT